MELYDGAAKCTLEMDDSMTYKKEVIQNMMKCDTEALPMNAALPEELMRVY